MLTSSVVASAKPLRCKAAFGPVAVLRNRQLAQVKVSRQGESQRPTRSYYGSTQLVVPPMPPVPRVAANCGLQTTSVLPPLPLTVVSAKSPIERSL